jgi:hypothetical protein
MISCLVSRHELINPLLSSRLGIIAPVLPNDMFFKLLNLDDNPRSKFNTKYLIVPASPPTFLNTDFKGL